MQAPVSIPELLTHIDKIERTVSADDWARSLDDRKRDELTYHDKLRDPTFIAAAADTQNYSDTYERFYGNRRYYSTITRSRDYTQTWIEQNAPGKVFLEYCCGNGRIAMEGAKAGAALAMGLDISDVSVRNARAAAEKAGLTNTRFFQADAENTMLPDDSVDSVVCAGVLHHLDVTQAFPELLRILKPGGKLFASEALSYNPVIKLYRNLTPDMRTEWEKNHILSHKDLRLAEQLGFAVERVKYWHVVGYAGVHLGPFGRVLDLADRVLERVPGIQLMSWIFTFELTKRA